VKSHFKGTIQKSQNHGNAFSNHDKKLMEAVNENFVYKVRFKERLKTARVAEFYSQGTISLGMCGKNFIVFAVFITWSSAILLANKILYLAASVLVCVSPCMCMCVCVSTETLKNTNQKLT